MNVEIIRKVDGRLNRKTGVVISGRLRVTAYARVSSGDEEQLNSYNSQKLYYKDKITSNQEWEYIEMYADEAISGTLDYKRTSFMKMIEDGLNHKFDVILTKSISRFARNTLDTLKYVRMLKEKNIAVIFEEENINTLEMAGELLLTILSSIAQQESETISSHVKLGLKMKKERGELVGFNNCLGYKYNSKNKSLEIVEEEAEIVRIIFNKYLDGYGSESIAKMLTNMGYRTPRGNKKWFESTIRKVLRNEKYKGDVLQGKTFTVDPITHKRLINLGEEDKYYITGHHKPIIEPETFDLVQNIIENRCGVRATGRRLGNVGRKYTMSNRTYCGFCGEVLTRRSIYVGKNTKMPHWLCLKAAKYGRLNCIDSKQIKEEIIQDAFVDSYKLLCDNKSFIVNDFLNNIKESTKEISPKYQLEKIKNQKYSLKSKKDKLLELMIEGTIPKEEYTEKVKIINKKIEKLEKQIIQFELLVEDDRSIENGIEKFEELINNNDTMEVFDEEIFDALIDYVVIGGYDENSNKDNALIRFVLKRQFDLTEKKDIHPEDIVSNNRILNSKENIILDFSMKYTTRTFDKDENGKISMNLRNNLRILVEYSII